MAVNRSIYWNLRTVLLHSVVPLTAAALMPAVFAQPPTAVKNWPMSAASASSTAAPGSGAGLIFIAITPCRVMDTRGAGGSGKTGAFGAPSLVAGQPRVVPVPVLQLRRAGGGRVLHEFRFHHSGRAAGRLDRSLAG